MCSPSQAPWARLVLGLWVRDDSGTSIADTVMNHAVTVCMCVLLLVFCVYMWCSRSRPERHVRVQIADPGHTGSVSVRFNQDLNVHVGVAAPGTPATRMPSPVMMNRQALHMCFLLRAKVQGPRLLPSQAPDVPNRLRRSDAPVLLCMDLLMTCLLPRWRRRRPQRRTAAQNCPRSLSGI